MRNNDRILNSLYASSIITAGVAWITIVILLGVLNRSILTGLLAGISCGLYATGYNIYGGIGLEQGVKIKRSLPLFLLSAGFALVSLLQSNFHYWWLWVILVVLQIPPYILDRMIMKNVSPEIVEEAKRKAEADWREERLRAASQASSTSEFAEALGLKVISDRSEQENRLIQQATRELNSQDELYARRLVAIFHEAASLYDLDKGAYEKKRAEARQIGEMLSNKGGGERMRLVAYRVQALGGKASDCGRAWEGICSWLA